MPIWASERTSGHPTPIPYPPNPESPHPGQGYFNVRRDPSLLPRLLEARNIPGFLKLLSELNAPTSPYHTVGSDWAISQDDSVPGYRTKLTSYVQLVFEPLAWNMTRVRYGELYEALKSYEEAHGPLPINEGIEFEYDPVVFREFGNVVGWSITFWVHGYGRNGLEVRPAWRRATDFLRGFLLNESERLRRQISEHDPTVSGVSFNSGDIAWR
jgi:hypothetical protein